MLLVLKAVPAYRGCHIKQCPLESGLFVQLSLYARKYPFKDSRHRNHDRGPDVLQIFSQLCNGARIGHG